MLVVVAVGLPLETIAADRLSRLTGDTPRRGGPPAAHYKATWRPRSFSHAQVAQYDQLRGYTQAQAGGREHG